MLCGVPQHLPAAGRNDRGPMGELFLSSVAAGGKQDIQNTLNGTKHLHLNN